MVFVVFLVFFLGGLGFSAGRLRTVANKRWLCHPGVVSSNRTAPLGELSSMRMTSAAVCTRVGDADPGKERGGRGAEVFFFHLIFLSFFSSSPSSIWYDSDIKKKRSAPKQLKKRWKKTDRASQKKLLQAKSNFSQKMSEKTREIIIITNRTPPGFFVFKLPQKKPRGLNPKKKPYQPC